jgi:hypothetical protein
MVPIQPVKMVSVDADLIEAVGYKNASRQLLIKLRNADTLCYENVPHFRHEGLLSATRKDAYYRTFIQHSYLVKKTEPPPQT